MNCKNLLLIPENGIWTEVWTVDGCKRKVPKYQLTKIEVSRDTDTYELQKRIAYSRKWNFDKS